MMVIQELILESEILRVENDNDGPQDELEYWKSRAAKLTLLVEQISSHECKMTLGMICTFFRFKIIIIFFLSFKSLLDSNTEGCTIQTAKGKYIFMVN